MSNLIKKISVILMSLVIISCAVIPQLSLTAYAAEADETAVADGAEETTAESENTVKSHKAFSAAIVVGVVAALAAVSMAVAISKSNESIARQPEAASQIRSGLMLGLVFIETVVIYALIVAILVIFVL